MTVKRRSRPAIAEMTSIGETDETGRSTVVKTVYLAMAIVVSSTRDAGASAASRLVYVRSDAAAHCPDEKGLRAAVARRLGYDPFFPWAERTISIDVVQDAGKLRARLKSIDRDGIARGERELIGPVEECAELIASLAIAISITLDPMAAAPKDAAPDPAPPPNEPPSPAPPHVQVPTVDTAPRAARDTPSDDAVARVVFGSSATTWAVRAGPLVALGAGPGASLGGRVGLAVTRGWLGAFAEMRVDAPSSVAASGALAHSMLWGVSLGPCLHEGFFSGCAVLLAGSLNAYGSGLERVRSESMFYTAAGARVEGTFVLYSKVDLVLHVDGLKTLTEATLSLREEEAWHTPAFSAAAGAAASIRFP
jgi:hypothetical protein